MGKYQKEHYIKNAIVNVVIATILGMCLGLWRGLLMNKGGISALSASNAWGLYLVVVAVALILVAVAFYTREFAYNTEIIEQSDVYKILYVLSAFALVIAGALTWYENKEHFTLIAAVQAAFPVFCGAAALIRLKGKDEGELSGLLTLAPVFYLCFFLLYLYRENASGTSVYAFAWEICICIFVMLGCYAVASGKFEDEKPMQRGALSMLCIGATCAQVVSMIVAMEQSLSVPGVSLSWFGIMTGFGIYCALSYIVPVKSCIEKDSADKAENAEEEQQEINEE